MSKKRLDHDDRINLQAGMAKGLSLRDVASMLKKSRSTIYREIINNSRYLDCKHTCAHCSKGCTDRASHYVNGQCKDFSAYECKSWESFPYTCNGCKESSFCKHRKRYYDCIAAHGESKRKRSVPRTFRGIGDDEMSAIDSIVSKGVELGQSLHHIYANSRELQGICCERTIRRYVYRGYLKVRAHQLPKYVRYSHKYDYGKPKVVNVGRMLGRTFSDYKRHMEENPDSNAWQYDSVEGKTTDKKAILTITYPEFRFQFGYLISKHSAASAYKKIRLLQKLLGARYGEIFEVNLSDNGTEFSRFHEVEFDADGSRICRVFFTNPYKSTDKASCERNHGLVRYVLYKGKSLDFMTQEKVELMFSHINSYTRGSNKDKTPYDLMVGRFGSEFMDIVGIRRIDAADVCLKPSLVA